ncbi:MAG: phosphoribosylanthranilate isomerase [Xanthomonadaceae bacterium]|nr:phosphoribosylanthranilate isomerase [Xanthomonadaceae bacterium]MDE2176800.1 phosphoribosylanthranilate isomerase [Xanthomonadaceae bacterium]MDE2245004.1 phosphoribosylanthranilate isomerase [Xanthomonadaceae bacterium]
MQPLPRVKVCCIRDRDEARIAVRHGVSALGLVSAMPSGPGVLDEDAIAAIAADVPPGVATFLLTALRDAEAIIDQQRRCGCNTVQMVDAVPVAAYPILRRALPGIALVQVIHVRTEEEIVQAHAAAAYVDALLLDSGDPSLPVRELGGTGRVHDWSLSRRIAGTCARPVFLAGGLHAGNVSSAIAAVRPFGLDLCTGVRTDGRLDEYKLTAFLAAVRTSGNDP